MSAALFLSSGPTRLRSSEANATYCPSLLSIDVVDVPAKMAWVCPLWASYRRSRWIPRPELIMASYA
jgi:hypothetical protein